MLWHRTVGDGPSLVLLHGWAFNSDIFQSLVDKYKANYRVTVIDLPGHGRSNDIDGDIESWCNETNQANTREINPTWLVFGWLTINLSC